MFAVGFGLGSQFAYFVYIMSCTGQQKGICHAFCKMLRNKSPYQTAKKRSDAVGPKSKEIKVKFFLFPLAWFSYFSLCFSQWILDFIKFVFLGLENDLSHEFQRNSITRLARGSVLHFIGHWHDCLDTY